MSMKSLWTVLDIELLVDEHTICTVTGYHKVWLLVEQHVGKSLDKKRVA